MSVTETGTEARRALAVLAGSGSEYVAARRGESLMAAWESVCRSGGKDVKTSEARYYWWID